MREGERRETQNGGVGMGVGGREEQVIEKDTLRQRKRER